MNKNYSKTYSFSSDINNIIKNENLLPKGLLKRLEQSYSSYSRIKIKHNFFFSGKNSYIGIKGFNEIVKILEKNNINIGHLDERILFIKVYRFMATKHVLNNINWNDFENDSLFQLTFPQPGMIRKDITEKYLNAKIENEQKTIIKNYIKETNPHDGKQKLNKPTYINAKGKTIIVEGSQHKYPQCNLVFDVETQNCFAFCNYCFRHAQVRGDEDMFIQKDINQIHEYIKHNKDISDLLITGGDGGFISYQRFKQYVEPIIKDNDLKHIKTIRIGTRILSYEPEFIISKSYNKMLKLFQKLYDNGIQLVFMSHFSTPSEVLNIATISAIRRLKRHGVTVKSQSPIMNHISLFLDKNGKVDVDRSAKNWIDLANILAMLGVGFHSMYCARPTGEHHYFTQPLSEINKVFSKVYRSLSSINRPSRYITMTSSAGKISLLGTVDIEGEKAFALKFNEGRNMEWMDKVYLAEYDENENDISKLKPYRSKKHFYENELSKIEENLHKNLTKK